MILVFLGERRLFGKSGPAEFPECVKLEYPSIRANFPEGKSGLGDFVFRYRKFGIFAYWGER